MILKNSSFRVEALGSGVLAEPTVLVAASRAIIGVSVFVVFASLGLDPEDDAAATAGFLLKLAMISLFAVRLPLPGEKVRSAIRRGAAEFCFTSSGPCTDLRQSQ